MRSTHTRLLIQSDPSGSFFQKVLTASGREIRLLGCIMHKIAEGDLQEALNIIAYRNNRNYLASTLGQSFFVYQCLSEEELIKRSYDLLRQITTNIVIALSDCSEGNFKQNPSYQRVAELLFKKFGLRAPLDAQ